VVKERPGESYPGRVHASGQHIAHREALAVDDWRRLWHVVRNVALDMAVAPTGYLKDAPFASRQGVQAELTALGLRLLRLISRLSLPLLLAFW
jgi:hypothetical protein